MNKKNIEISESTLKRLSDYLCVLNYLRDEGVEIVSSSLLAKMMNINDFQIRKDLSYFGSIGKKGVGYNVEKFIETIEDIMNLKNTHSVCIIGVGRLGTALMNYKRLNTTPFKIAAAYDSDKNKINKRIGKIKIYNIEDIEKINKKIPCDIAILTVPSYVVHNVFAKVSRTDIRAILNFTPIILTGDNKKLIRNFDFVSELKIISYLLKEQKNDSKIKK